MHELVLAVLSYTTEIERLERAARSELFRAPAIRPDPFAALLRLIRASWTILRAARTQTASKYAPRQGIA